MLNGVETLKIFTMFGEPSQHPPPLTLKQLSKWRNYQHECRCQKRLGVLLDTEIWKGTHMYWFLKTGKPN